MIERLVSSLEQTPVTVAGWLAAFAGVVWVRYLLEAFSSPDLQGFIASDLPTLASFMLYYLAITMSIVVVVSLVTRLSGQSVLRLSLFILPIIWLGPLIDLVRGVPAKISYVIVETPKEFFQYFLTYFGPRTDFGATVGLRIEAAILFMLIGGYVYIRTRRLVSAAVSSLVAYTILYLSATLPSLIGFLLPGGLTTGISHALISRIFFHPSETYIPYRLFELLATSVMSQVFFIVLCVVSAVWLWLAATGVGLALLKNLRLERVGHYVVMAILGGLIALGEGVQVSWSVLDAITITVALIEVVLAWTLAVIVNDLIDEPIDAISNIKRPLITGALSRTEMQNAGVVCMCLLVLGGFALGSYSLFFIGVFSAIAYIYSAPPLRLKRIPLFASLLIGVATLVMMLFGFFLISTDRGIAAFPPPIALLVVLFVALVSNVRDLKDLEGDAAAGIWTLPTLLGEKRARMAIGAMTFLACACVPLFIPIAALWVPSVVMGGISWVALVLKRKEKFLFGLYFVYLVVVVGLLTVV